MATKRFPHLKLIALEEHFLYSELLAHYDEEDRTILTSSRAQGIEELGAIRLKLMDDVGIDVQVLSHTKPGVQELEDQRQAVSFAAAANDHLAQAVAVHPERFAGFATLATGAPAEAARELERTVRQYGFKGAMINGHCRGEYLDDPKFWAIFEAAEALDVPI
ncbi:MAG: amidohydrolase family protein, partial [Burkholderiaceae bacterium]